MKKTRSIISALLVICILFSISSISLFRVNAEYIKYDHEMHFSGDYAYSFASHPYAKDDIVIDMYLGNDEVVEIPSTIDGYTVRGINGYGWRVSYDDEPADPNSSMSMDDWDNRFYPHGAFEHNQTIKKVIIPFDVWFIGTYIDGLDDDDYLYYYKPFKDCPNLEEVQFVTNENGAFCCDTFGAGIFSDCPKLKKINLISGVFFSQFAFDDDITIYSFSGSPAEKYAKKYNYKFVDLTTYRLQHDITGDGTLNISDVTLAQKYIAKITELSDEQLKKADFNGDGAVNVIDITGLQKLIAGHLSVLN